MNKTLHQKLTDKHQYTYPSFIENLGNDDQNLSFRQEQMIVREASKDMLSPRPEVVARILEMSRML